MNINSPRLFIQTRVLGQKPNSLLTDGNNHAKEKKSGPNSGHFPSRSEDDSLDTNRTQRINSLVLNSSSLYLLSRIEEVKTDETKYIGMKVIRFIGMRDNPSSSQ